MGTKNEALALGLFLVPIISGAICSTISAIKDRILGTGIL